MDERQGASRLAPRKAAKKIRGCVDTTLGFAQLNIRLLHGAYYEYLEVLVEEFLIE